MLSCSIPSAPGGGGLPRRQSHCLGKHAGIFQNDFRPCLPYTLFQCLFSGFPMSLGSSVVCDSPPPPILLPEPGGPRRGQPCLPQIPGASTLGCPSPAKSFPGTTDPRAAPRQPPGPAPTRRPDLHRPPSVVRSHDLRTKRGRELDNRPLSNRPR